jgi:hypothetical protein
MDYVPISRAVTPAIPPSIDLDAFLPIPRLRTAVGLAAGDASQDAELTEERLEAVLLAEAYCSRYFTRRDVIEVIRVMPQQRFLVLSVHPTTVVTSFEHRRNSDDAWAPITPLPDLSPGGIVVAPTAKPFDAGDYQIEYVTEMPAALPIVSRALREIVRINRLEATRDPNVAEETVFDVGSVMYRGARSSLDDFESRVRSGGTGMVLPMAAASILNVFRRKLL